MEHVELTPQLILQAYANGVFPMGEARDDDRIYWVAPKLRGIIPLNGFHVSRSLAKLIRKDRYQITFNRDFAGVMAGCAEREETWINDQILSLYLDMHEAGHAHSVECWKDGTLAGGLYGVSLGAAFFGESMFSRQTDASKVALVHLVARLREGGYMLLDTQFNTEHLKRFGAETIAQESYLERLERAIMVPAEFSKMAESLNGAQLLQSITQTS